MTTTAEILIQGEWTIMQIVKNGRELAAEHFETLAAQDYRKVAAFLGRVAAIGPLHYGQEKNRKLGDQIFELKPTSEVRLPYFFDGARTIVITTPTRRRTESVARDNELTHKRGSHAAPLFHFVAGSNARAGGG